MMPRRPAHNLEVAETLREALANLRAQGRRSALALLGILIGTASIVAMLNIGHIAQLETSKLFSHLGADMVQLRAMPTGAAPAALDRELIEQLPARDPDVAWSLPLATGRAQVAFGSQRHDMLIVAITPALPRLAGLHLERGRSIAAIDQCAMVAVAGAEAATQLSSPGNQLMPTGKVAIGDYVYSVIGTLRPSFAEALSPGDYNKALLIPLDCARRVLGSSAPTTAMVRLRPGADAEKAGARLSGMLANASSSIEVISARQLIKTMNEQKAVHTSMLAAIGGISLLVGGIGVMNVMLMSVMERRSEIGLRAAIGATPRDLQLMFTVEAGVLALAGGVAGTLIGVLIAWIMAQYSGWTFDLAFYVLPLGSGMAAIVGLVFGLYPAITAARLHPIEALRAD
ncbi:putative ABC transport system permease protein [Sphingomonas laterariae]|uniref:Putative ABC transport system permease protein n=1 Tax=Edaphosphingomonas laterariae TaxID=861865 RepID=A0A239HY12_9SPHN|nr:ABC transporter permease [Sphingomonas laterariae]SNS86280.1 putative ABC transport system permease protein [Sphingomonas laterariae]